MTNKPNVTSKYEEERLRAAEQSQIVYLQGQIDELRRLIKDQTNKYNWAMEQVRKTEAAVTQVQSLVERHAGEVLQSGEAVRRDVVALRKEVAGALVKIDATDLPVPEFVHPANVKIGQWACALGRTFATEEPTVHIGIVSAQRRVFGRALQIDAYTSPANYGGPVVDVHGRVLGMAVPLSPAGRNAGVEWYDSGIGFAVTIAYKKCSTICSSGS